MFSSLLNEIKDHPTRIQKCEIDVCIMMNKIYLNVNEVVR
jgi:hypothetical protein